MDVKRWLGTAMIPLLSIATIGCQKPEQKEAVIIDDQSSEYSGKLCYGSRIDQQYILTWSDGTVSVFRGSLDQLSSKVALSKASPHQKFIVMAEQDRQISLKKLRLNISTEQDLQGVRNQGEFWQVWGQEDIEAQTLWEENIKGQGVTVAVIDTGVDLNHPSLSQRIQINEGEIPENGMDDDGNGLIDDVTGFDFAYKNPVASPSDHGTHVAGIIAADPKNSPMVGVAPEAKILPLNIMDEGGGGSLSAALMAIQYAQSRGVKIINASWGGAMCAESLKRSIASLRDKNILFIAAAGNDGVDIEIYPEFPAGFALENQITVGANMPSGLMAGFSNYSYRKVHLLAPGHQILSSVLGGWLPASGTSMATPFVSGVAALLWSKYPQATLSQVKRAILSSVKTPHDYTPVMSGGRVNAPLALEKLEAILREVTQ